MKNRAHNVRSRQATAQYGAHVGDAAQQVALLSARIDALANHLQTHQRDYHSRRGLLSLVGRRSRLLATMAKKDPAGTAALAARLGLHMAAPENGERASS